MGGTCSGCTVQDTDITEMRLDPKAGSKAGSQDPRTQPGGKQEAGEGPATPLLARAGKQGKAAKGGKSGNDGIPESSLEDLLASGTPLPDLPEDQGPASEDLKPSVLQAGDAFGSRGRRPAGSPGKEAAADKLVASLVGDVADRALDIALGSAAAAPRAKKQPKATPAPTSWRHLPSVGTWLLKPSSFRPVPTQEAEPAKPVLASFVAAVLPLLAEGSFVAMPAVQAEASFVAVPASQAVRSPMKAAAPLALPKMAEDPAFEAEPPSPAKAAAPLELPKVADEAACEVLEREDLYFPSPVKAAIPAPASPAKAAAPAPIKAWYLLPSAGTWLLAPPRIAPAAGRAEVMMSISPEGPRVEEVGSAAPAAAADDLASGEEDGAIEKLNCSADHEGDDRPGPGEGVDDRDAVIETLKARMASKGEAPVISQV